MKNFSTKNLLILVRHGERADHAGLIPKFHPLDAELTDLGKTQANKIGLKISEYLNKNYKKVSKIKILSSPFARTIQTSKKILNALKNNKSPIEDIIEIDYYFSECRKSKDFRDPYFVSFIILLNKFDLLETELEDTKIIFKNQPENIVEKTFESIEECFIRMGKGLKILFEDEFISENQEINQDGVNVIIIVSHGEPITQINRNMNYPGILDSDLVLYCDSFLYEIEYSNYPGLQWKYLDALSLFKKKN